VERALLAGEALAQDLGIFVNENAHVEEPLKSFTAEDAEDAEEKLVLKPLRFQNY
jgi:hypothetical protein